MTEPTTQATKPDTPSNWRKWRRRSVCAALVYTAVCLAVWAMAETDYRRVLAGGKPFFAHYRAGLADGGSVEYWGPAYSYLLHAVHSYANPRPSWGHGDGWAYDDGAALSYGPHLLPLNLFAKESLRTVPGDSPGQIRALFLEIETQDRIYVYGPDLPEGIRPKPHTKAEAEKIIGGLQGRLLPAAQVTLAKGLRSQKLDAAMGEIQVWLAGHGISTVTFRVPQDYGTSVIGEVGPGRREEPKP